MLLSLGRLRSPKNSAIASLLFRAHVAGQFALNSKLAIALFFGRNFFWGGVGFAS